MDLSKVLSIIGAAACVTCAAQAYGADSTAPIVCDASTVGVQYDFYGEIQVAGPKSQTPGAPKPTGNHIEDVTALGITCNQVAAYQAYVAAFTSPSNYGLYSVVTKPWSGSCEVGGLYAVSEVPLYTAANGLKISGCTEGTLCKLYVQPNDVTVCYPFPYPVDRPRYPGS